MASDPVEIILSSTWGLFKLPKWAAMRWWVALNGRVCLRYGLKSTREPLGYNNVTVTPGYQPTVIWWMRRLDWRELGGLSFHSSGISRALIASFSSWLLCCLGAWMIVASTI